MDIKNIGNQSYQIKLIPNPNGEHVSFVAPDDMTFVAHPDGSLTFCLAPKSNDIYCEPSLIAIENLNNPVVYDVNYHIMYKFNDGETQVFQGGSSEYGHSIEELLFNFLNQQMYLGNKVLNINADSFQQEASYFNFTAIGSYLKGSDTVSNNQLDLHLIKHEIEDSLDVVGTLFNENITLHSCSPKQWKD